MNRALRSGHSILRPAFYALSAMPLLAACSQDPSVGRNDENVILPPAPPPTQPPPTQPPPTQPPPAPPPSPPSTPPTSGSSFQWCNEAFAYETEMDGLRHLGGCRFDVPGTDIPADNYIGRQNLPQGGLVCLDKAYGSGLSTTCFTPVQECPSSSFSPTPSLMKYQPHNLGPGVTLSLANYSSFPQQIDCSTTQITHTANVVVLQDPFSSNATYSKQTTPNSLQFAEIPLNDAADVLDVKTITWTTPVCCRPAHCGGANTAAVGPQRVCETATAL
jgi:hypothetical protein